MFTMPRALPRQVTGPVVAVLAAIGVTPNMLTAAQLIGGIAAAHVIGSGHSSGAASPSSWPPRSMPSTAPWPERPAR